MNMLATLTTADDIATEKDSVGGNAPLDSAIYPMKVGMASSSPSRTKMKRKPVRPCGSRPVMPKATRTTTRRTARNPTCQASTWPTACAC
jgi:hypothetical protein